MVLYQFGDTAFARSIAPFEPIHGHRGVHHEILRAVIQEERSDWQALTAATLHNAPLRIMEMCCSTFPLRQAG